MKSETVSLLCGPGTHEPLKLDNVPNPDGSTQQILVGINSNKKYAIRDGIPLLLDEEKITGYNQQYQGLYNKVARFYDGGINLFASLVGKGEGYFRKEYLHELNLRDGDRLLEVSVGTGANLHFLPVKAACYGLDISWGMLKRCQMNLKRWQLEAELIFGNAEELPLLDETFDGVLHVGGINAFNDRAKAIIEMIRVAKSGSRIVIVDETVKMMETFSWMPSVRKWLREHRERFSAPVGLVPKGMNDVRVKEIAGGNLYCLDFSKP